MRGECLDDAGDGVPQGVDGAGGGFSKGGLELGEGVLDGVEGGALGRKKQQQGADRLDSGADGRALVGGQAVHHDDVAGGEGRDQRLLHIGVEGGAVHGAVQHHGGAVMSVRRRAPTKVVVFP